jgi:branched-subunit amino acid aminotransferase/4-amino-4-deoxychorismate lyase
MIYGAKFDGVWLVGTAMVRAKNKQEAAERLQTHLDEMGMPQKITEDDIVVFKRGTCVVTLTDGDY